MEETGMIAGFLAYLGLERNRSQLTLRAYGDDLKKFLGFLSIPAMSAGNIGVGETLEDTVLFEAGPREVREWLAYESRSGCGARSLRRKAQSLRSFYAWAVKTGKTNHNPASSLQLAKAPKPLPAFVGADDMEKTGEVRLAADPVLEMRDHLIVEILYCCGLRRAELRAITDSDINHGRKELRVHGKGGKTRIIPLAEELLGKIAVWQKVRDGVLFGKWKGSGEGEGMQNRFLIPGRGGKALSEKRISDIVGNALAGAKATRRSPHTLRHSFATAMLNGGADIMTVKEFLGHSSLSSTQIYTHLNFNELQRDYMKAHPRASVESTRESEEGGSH